MYSVMMEGVINIMKSETLDRESVEMIWATLEQYKDHLQTAGDELLLVDIILNGQQVIGHGLKCELVQKWRDRVKTSIQNQ